MKTLKGILIGIVIGIVVGALAMLGIQSLLDKASNTHDTTESTITVLKEEMVKNSELSTAKFLYTDSVSVTDQHNLGFLGHEDILLPFTDAAYVLEFDGAINAGFDLEQAEVSNNNGTIEVTLPQPSILSHEASDVRITYKRENILNPLHIGEESQWLSEKKHEMVEQAIAEGIYNEAKQNAKVAFESLFASVIPEGTTVEVRFVE